jgi:hypothetical protein
MGSREERDYVKGYYAAYVLDPDGNNVERLYYQPLWLSPHPGCAYGTWCCGFGRVELVGWC